ncbi:hypothetical protein HNP84_003155 [Thermocatellispora tengchongensis]|uniref:Uncharacterized protein n=1 Tax=Thermocatellispora tengchongensis TaxID=1073253 RepID=A0A840P371_9ACTN|nr:hypothetical protein [Thermocatellispora tengchongensis]MBB5133429.1 hypothetical protein [Thermocatellispora tengchongensis]
MPDAPGPIARHAAVLTADSDALAEAAERLRAVEARLGASGAAPQWLHEAVAAHLAACATAAADLAEAADRLRRYAESAGP